MFTALGFRLIGFRELIQVQALGFRVAGLSFRVWCFGHVRLRGNLPSARGGGRLRCRAVGPGIYGAGDRGAGAARCTSNSRPSVESIKQPNPKPYKP